MKQLVLTFAVLVAGSALAQEIGTEITPTTPTSGVQNQNQNQNPPPEQPKGGYVYKPKGAAGSSSEPTFTGTKVSAASGDFGIRAGFDAAVASAGITTSLGGPSVGISYFASDSFKLLVDLGLGLGITSRATTFSVSTTLGFDLLFRNPGDALRPFFHFAALFGLNSLGNSTEVGFGAQLGFGAEYFFNPAFAVNGRLMLAVPMAVPGGNFAVGLILVPAVGATWYL